MGLAEPLARLMFEDVIEDWKNATPTLLANTIKQFTPFFYLRLRNVLQEAVKRVVIPIGICVMSEKQGGQHEVGIKPVQAAASFYATMTVDGQNRDVVNIWRGVNIQGGDSLILRLDFDEDNVHGANRQYHYTLNHYYKGYESREVRVSRNGNVSLQGPNFSWFRDVASAAYNPEKRGVAGQQNNDRTSPYRPEAFAQWVCVTKKSSVA